MMMSFCSTNKPRNAGVKAFPIAKRHSLKPLHATDAGVDRSNSRCLPVHLLLYFDAKHHFSWSNPSSHSR